MNSIERMLGRLEENQRSTNERLDAIEEKIDSLQSFKWKMIGGSAILSVLLSLVVEVLVFHK
jgi:hypothetical protein